jgi:hypothetical protein
MLALMERCIQELHKLILAVLLFNCRAKLILGTQKSEALALLMIHLKHALQTQLKGQTTLLRQYVVMELCPLLMIAALAGVALEMPTPKVLL